MSPAISGRVRELAARMWVSLGGAALISDAVISDAVTNDVVISDLVISDAVITDVVITNVVITDVVVTDVVITDAVTLVAIRGYLDNSLAIDGRPAVLLEAMETIGQVRAGRDDTSDDGLISAMTTSVTTISVTTINQ
jgi:hypothetical protein